MAPVCDQKSNADFLFFCTVGKWIIHLIFNQQLLGALINHTPFYQNNSDINGVVTWKDLFPKVPCAITVADMAKAQG